MPTFMTRLHSTCAFVCTKSVTTDVNLKMHTTLINRIEIRWIALKSLAVFLRARDAKIKTFEALIYTTSKRGVQCRT